MKKHTILKCAAFLIVASSHSAVRAQEAVTARPAPDELFRSADPKLNRNLRSAYHIMRDLLEGGHWEMASSYLTARYIQHNPNVASGRDSVVKFFASIGAKPKPVNVAAQGDYVVVVTVATLPDPRSTGKTYTTSWFDMWRFVDGKADEHWDSATLMPPLPK